MTRYSVRWLATASVLLAGCHGPPRPNVLLISIDTLRADHLTSYGFARDTSPNIDGLAREGVRFDNVQSPVPLTLPAHSSMLTGKIPPRHGMHDNLSYRLSDEEVTLAELLGQNGYATGAIVSSFVLDSRFNLSQGFGYYNDQFEEEHKIAFLSERKGSETTRLARDWLATHRDAPFFLFLHYYDPHEDYDPPEPFATRYADDLYAGEVAYTDQLVGEVFAKLEELDLYDSTLIVVTADHGEMLGEHGELTHGFFIYESALRVPLVMKAPNVEPSVVKQRVGLIDVMPTVAGLLELELSQPTQGRNLAPLMKGASAKTGSERRELFAESVTANRYYDANTLLGLVTEEWKYIHTTRPELYNLEQDPTESVNVIDQHPRIAEGMRARLEMILEEQEDASSGELDAAARRRMASLGYLAGGTESSRLALDVSKEDPKDWVEFYRDHQQLEKLVNEEAFERAAALAQKLLGVKPDFVAAHLQLARIATEQRHLVDAIAHYERALELDPGNVGARYNLANIFATRGEEQQAAVHYRKVLEADPDFEDAESRLAQMLAVSGQPRSIGALQEVIAREPRNAEAHHQLGLALRDQGRVDESLTHLQTAVSLEPGLAAAYNDLGVTLKQQGRLDEALAQYRRALELDPGLALAYNNMGSLLGSRGQVREAMEHFRKALEVDPGYGEAHNNLGLAIRMTGGRDEAIGHFRAALASRPDWPVPLNQLAWILATHPSPGVRDPGEAVRLAERAVQLTGGSSAVMLDTLAAAYAASGSFDRAVTTSEKAVALASSRDPRLAAELTTRLELYRQGRPFTES